MNMICHEAIGMKTITIARQHFAHVLQINSVVFWFEETGFTVIASLNNMIGISWDVHPWTTRHGNSFC